MGLRCQRAKVINLSYTVWPLLFIVHRRHPDKHPDNQEEAKAKFQVIQRAYDALMSTDEEEVQMQLGAA